MREAERMTVFEGSAHEIGRWKTATCESTPLLTRDRLGLSTYESPQGGLVSSDPRRSTRQAESCLMGIQPLALYCCDGTLSMAVGRIASRTSHVGRNFHVERRFAIDAVTCSGA